MKLRGLRLALVGFAVGRLVVLDAVAQAPVSRGVGKPPSGTEEVSAETNAGSSLAVTGTALAGNPSGDRYAKAKVLDERITADPRNASLLSRVRLVRTDDAKYPLVRVEDKLTVDPETGGRRVLQQQAMIADHIVVKLKPGASGADLAPLMQPLGAKIREQLPESELYLIEFPHPGIDTVPHAVGHFVGTQIEYAGPDDLSSIQATPQE